MRVLVTGATGFIGRSLVARLLSRGNEVRVLARQATDGVFDSAVQVAAGRLEDLPSLRAAVAGVDVVYHCAGLLGKWGMTEQQLRVVNAGGVENILTACLDSPVRHVIHLSAGGVTGPVPVEAVDETYPCLPLTAYERTKWEGERVALDMVGTHGLPVTVARPTFTYGPGDLHKLPLFRAVAKRIFAFVGDGESTVHPVYIDDLIDGLERCAQTEPAGRVYILGGPRPVTKNELIRSIAKSLGVPVPRIHLPVLPTTVAAASLEVICKVLPLTPPLTRSRVFMLSRNWGYSIERARRELDYRPRVDLEEGIKRTAAWYREQGHL